MHLGDLVQEEGSPVRPLERALHHAGGPRERTLLVAEEGALDQCCGQRGAVHGDEGTVRAIAPVVDRACHQLLAGARLPLDQYGGTRGRYGAYALDHAREGIAISDEGALATELPVTSSFRLRFSRWRRESSSA
jgi:hypothetical protein